MWHAPLRRLCVLPLLLLCLSALLLPAVVQGQKYSHRGFMLDTGRKFFPVPSIKAILDSMYQARMNVFHWHLYDSQSLPLEWAYNGGLLTSLGSFKDPVTGRPLVYNRTDIVGVVAYAAARGIQVIPEFEMPGHADVWALAFPSIISCNPDINNPSGQFNLANPGTQTVLAQLFADMLPLFNSTNVHVGGDEVAFCWPDPTPKATYQSFYNTFVLGQMRTHARTPTVWADTVLDAKLQLSKSYRVQTWRNAADASTIASAGYSTIVSTSATWYVGNATPDKIRAFQFPKSTRVIGAELCWFTSPADNPDPSDLQWIFNLISAAGLKMWQG